MTMLVTFALGAASATTALAQESRLFERSRHAPPIFAAAPLAAAAQAKTASPSTNEHQLGVGVRLGGFTFGIGFSFRYFLEGRPYGVQLEVSRYSVDYGPTDFDSTQFSPAFIYRFPERTFDAPISLAPYAGGGVSIIRSSFDNDFDEFCDDDPFCEDLFDDVDDAFTDTSTGVLLFGGVEIYFERVPNLGVSGELTYNSNDDIGLASLGGPAFTVAGHWYFK
jgi:hypothetical protein